MKLFNILGIFAILICIQNRRGSGLINKCKKWKNWSECKNNFIVRYCISDKSLYEATDCENCGQWTHWSVCEEGKQHRHLAKCPHLKDERKCEHHQKNQASNNNDDINVELTGANINKKKLKQSLKPPVIYKLNNKRGNIITDSGDPDEIKNVNEENVDKYVVENVDENVDENVNKYVNKYVNEEDLIKHGDISNIQNKYETNQKNLIVKNEPGKGHALNVPDILSSVEDEQEQKHTVNKSFLNETPHNTETFADVQHKADRVEDFTLQSNPQISKHKILEEMEENTTGSTSTATSTASLLLNANSNVNESEAKNETEVELSSLPEFKFKALKKDTSQMNAGENVFSETGATETATAKSESREESESKSEEDSKEGGTSRGFNSLNANVLVAAGVAASVLSFGTIAACVYANKKKTGREIEIESKNENYEVIFNEDDKVDHNKILYEEEFWGYE